jgi:hypothetical protein
VISLIVLAIVVVALLPHTWHALSQYRARRASRAAVRRDSFTELLTQAEAERIRLQVDAEVAAERAQLEAERDQIPWR